MRILVQNLVQNSLLVTV